ncbi:hypothetical protein AYO21_10400 [Fonsecaea monophora]|uniref:Uncharacterized protein n=1 Tax=Fonsecaea monophora TaxID=254056 RepID=A0A177EVX8_9EURO|nr:hypothetical protein AYO21_10400 [Fonsecaea monophora]OAG35450.1 hypothetical protein AYO21_10400 [Fonsecaea monophora]
MSVPHHKSTAHEARKGAQEMFWPERVKVLLLTFDFNDLDLHKQTKKIHGDFESLGYEVQDYNINMSDPLSGLKTHLSEFLVKPDPSHPTLHIIYYHGHGGIVDTNKLQLFSHNIPKESELGKELYNLGRKVSKALESNESGMIVPSQLRVVVEDTRFRPIARVKWEQIQKTIMDAETHTIIILNCREAVLASVTSQENEKSSQKSAYRKELIGACGWGLSTRNDMSEAMCTIFKNLDKKKDDTMSAITLVSRMNHHMVKSFGGAGTVPQAVHYLLERSAVDSIRLPRLKERPPQTTHAG